MSPPAYLGVLEVRVKEFGYMPPVNPYGLNGSYRKDEILAYPYAASAGQAVSCLDEALANCAAYEPEMVTWPPR